METRPIKTKNCKCVHSRCYNGEQKYNIRYNLRYSIIIGLWETNYQRMAFRTATRNPSNNPTRSHMLAKKKKKNANRRQNLHCTGSIHTKTSRRCIQNVTYAQKNKEREFTTKRSHVFPWNTKQIIHKAGIETHLL